MTLHDDLATLREALSFAQQNRSGDHPAYAALDRVEAEIAWQDETRRKKTARVAELEAENTRLRDGLRKRERLLRWALNYIGIDWDESYSDEPPAVTEARALLADDGVA